jgi:peroxiredoxin
VPADAHGDFAEIGLPVGIVAPEIEGEDIDGTRFRLSEFRGKVVVLDCWVDR